MKKIIEEKVYYKIDEEEYKTLISTERCNSLLACIPRLFSVKFYNRKENEMPNNTLMKVMDSSDKVLYWVAINVVEGEDDNERKFRLLQFFFNNVATNYLMQYKDADKTTD